MIAKKFPILIFCLLSAGWSFAQKTDTLRLSTQQAEEMFLKNNLSLIAAQYNINASTALIKQARLWDNPLLLTDQTLYDGKFFNHTKSPGTNTAGEIYVQVQQLIRTAGKISKLTNVATASARVSEMQYQLLLRNLRYAIHNDLFQVQQVLTIAQAYDQELQQINKLYAGMQAQLQSGNISQKDFLRIQALQVSLLQELSEYKRQLVDVQSELHTLLQVKENVFLQPLLPAISIPALPISIDSMVSIAKQNNPEYLLEQSNYFLQQQNLNYQKSLRVPDVTVGVEYDKSNSYVPHYYGLTVALPLPVFNRNQGNIASAAFTMRQEQALLDQKELKLATDIQNAVAKLQLSSQLHQSIDPEFLPKYVQLIQNAIKAYQQRQLSLLEFLDLFDTYKETQSKYLQQQFNLLKTKEDLNLLTGKDII